LGGGGIRGKEKQEMKGPPKRKNPSPLFFKRKNPKASLVHIEPSNWMHETFLSKIVCHYF